MTLGELFTRAAGGCDRVGCDHRHSGPLFIHAGCHVDSKTVELYADPVARKLVVCCAVCRKTVVAITEAS